MSDSAPPRFNWLGLPPVEKALPSQQFPADVQAAFDRLAEAFFAIGENQASSLAEYLAVDPGRARFDHVTRPLSASRAKELLRRMTGAGTAPSSFALPDLTTASLARKALLARIFDLSRLEALQRACAAVPTMPFNGGQF